MSGIAARRLWTALGGVLLLGLACWRPANADGDSVRILTFNTHIKSPIMQCEGLWPDCALSGYDEKAKKAAQDISAVLKQGTFDVVALNEVWDEDDGKDIITEALDGVYPHYVKYVDVFGGGFEEDSGLMLFSQFPFEPLPNDQYVSEDNDTSYGTDCDRIAYVKFDDCEDPDCFAAKGAMLVRLRLPGSGRIVNIVVTHPQADYGDDNYSSVRARQFRQILGQCETKIAVTPEERSLVDATLSLSMAQNLCNWPNDQWLLVAGDLNIQGQDAVGEALYPAQAPNKGLSEYWYRIGYKAASAPTTGYALYDPWAETTSEADRGLTEGDERLDYILASRRTKTAALAAPPPDLCVQHVWNPPEFEGLSDHLALAADLNLEAPQCSPRLAHVLTPEEMGSVGLQEEKMSIKLGGALTYRGSMQWWRIEEPGTFTIALSPEAVGQGVTFQVYEADDLSHPLGGAHQLGPSDLLACAAYSTRGAGAYYRCEEVEGQEIVLPEAPFYLRVFYPDRSWSGAYWIAVHRHNCRSQADSCYLQPNQPVGFDFPAAGTYLNPEDTAWFRLQIQHQADTGNPQSLRFYTENAASGSWIEPKLALWDQSGSQEVSQIDGQSLGDWISSIAPSGAKRIALEAETSKNAAYYLSVTRSDVDQTLQIVAGWQTNLMLLGGSNVGPAAAQLVCTDETNPEGGVDEVKFQLNIDNGGWHTRGESDFECDNDSDLRNWDGPLGLIGYLQSVQFRLIEVDENAEDDESPIKDVGVWPMETAISGPDASSRAFSFVGGRYTFDFNVGKWLGQ